MFFPKVFFTFLFWTKINVQNRFSKNTFGKNMHVLTSSLSTFENIYIRPSLLASEEMCILPLPSLSYLTKYKLYPFYPFTLLPFYPFILLSFYPFILHCYNLCDLLIPHNISHKFCFYTYFLPLDFRDLFLRVFLPRLVFRRLPPV